MLRSIKGLYGAKLGASDGGIGRVKDSYFDDQQWAVRYLVADTGTWLPGRLVLIAPHACGSPDPDAEVLRVNLTRKQIENSPLLKSHQPVSRPYEEEYYRYYGWPFYWQGEALWGMSGVPGAAEKPAPAPGEHARAGGAQTEPAEAPLRSTQAVMGCSLQARDGTIGHVCDLMMDDRSWAIDQLVVRIGHRFYGKEVRIPSSQIDRINPDESSVFVNLTRQAIEQCPPHHVSPFGPAV